MKEKIWKKILTSVKRKLVKNIVTSYIVKKKLVLKNQVTSHIAVESCPTYIIVHK